MTNARNQAKLQTESLENRQLFQRAIKYNLAKISVQTSKNIIDSIEWDGFILDKRAQDILDNELTKITFSRASYPCQKMIIQKLSTILDSEFKDINYSNQDIYIEDNLKNSCGFSYIEDFISVTDRCILWFNIKDKESKSKNEYIINLMNYLEGNALCDYYDGYNNIDFIVDTSLDIYNIELAKLSLWLHVDKNKIPRFIISIGDVSDYHVSIHSNWTKQLNGDLDSTIDAWYILWWWFLKLKDDDITYSWSSEWYGSIESKYYDVIKESLQKYFLSKNIVMPNINIEYIS